MRVKPNFPELYFKQLNGGALVAFGKLRWSSWAAISSMRKGKRWRIRQQHGSGAYHDCASGIAMLVSSFQDRAGRLKLEVQKSG